MFTKISILGSGWLGLPLAQRLAQQGYTIRLSTRSPDKQRQLKAQGFDSYRVDLDAQQNLDAFLNSDLLIINITSKHRPGFEALIRQLEHAPVQQVLFISSTSVYRNLNRLVTEDESAENPDSVLWQIEQLFRAQTAFQTTIIRFAGLIDARRHPGRFFRNGRRVPQPDAPVNLIHLEDCLGIIEAVIAQQAWGMVFNGCADTHPGKREFYRAASRQAGFAEPDFSASDALSYKIVSNEKVKNILNYQFQHTDLMKINFND